MLYEKPPRLLPLSMPQGRVAVHCMRRKHLTRVPIVSQIYSQDQHIYQHLVTIDRVQPPLHEWRKYLRYNRHVLDKQKQL